MQQKDQELETGLVQAINYHQLYMVRCSVMKGKHAMEVEEMKRNEWKRECGFAIRLDEVKSTLSEREVCLHRR